MDRTLDPGRRPVIVLVVGGTRSGKSAVAEALAAARGRPVTYVATTPADDRSLDDRVAAHRSRRPASWSTVEVGAGDDLATAVSSVPGTVLVDALGPWVAGWWPATATSAPDRDAAAAGDELARALAARAGDAVVVAEEVGLAVHPPTASGRWFVDALGTVTQRVAAVADRVLLVVAGQVVELHPFDPAHDVPGWTA